MFKIALDAGHGMKTAGKRCMKKLDPNQTREWVLNDRICRKIAEKLKAYDGYELLRVDDTTGATDVSRANRAKRANAFGADLYLSIHHNAGIFGGKGGGIVAYVWKKASAELLSWQKMFYDALIAETGLKGNRATPCAKKNFDVLVLSNMPAILIENGFMDSATDVPIILTDAFAEKASTAYVKSLVEIGGLKKKTVEPPKQETAAAPEKETAAFTPYKVRVSISNLYIRQGAGTNTKKCGFIKKGVYTIVEEKAGIGASMWGKLKSGAGWIALDFVTRV